MNKVLIVLAGLSVLLASGCASRSSSVTPAAVSALEYAALSCEETTGLLSAKRQALAAAEKSQNTTATLDTVTTALILIPVASVFGADREGELSILKGEVLALERAVPQNCNKEERQPENLP